MSAGCSTISCRRPAPRRRLCARRAIRNQTHAITESVMPNPEDSVARDDDAVSRLTARLVDVATELALVAIVDPVEREELAARIEGGNELRLTLRILPTPAAMLSELDPRTATATCLATFS
jgi:hypothetical protein